MARKKKSPPPSFATMGDWHTHYLTLFDDQLNSLAYTSLSAHAKEAYTIIRQEYKGSYTGDQVICPYSTFEKKGMRANTLSRALLQLECYGFLKIDHGGLEHRPSVYHLIGDWKKIKTKEDLAEAKRVFGNELAKRKKASEVSAELRKRYKYDQYGKYTRSNETVSNEVEEITENDSGTDSIWDDLFGFKIPKPIAEQVTNPSASNEWLQVPKTMVAEEPGLYIPKH